MKFTLFFFLLFHASSQIISLTLGTYIPNRVTYYTWKIKLQNAASNAPVIFYFDAQVFILGNCEATINGEDVPVTYSNIMHSVQISGEFQGVTTVIMRNIQNPPFEMDSPNFYLYYWFDPFYSFGPLVKYRYEQRSMYFYGSGISIIWMVLIVGSYLRTGRTFFVPYCIIFFTSFIQTVVYAINTFLRKTNLLYLGEQWQAQCFNLIIVLYIVGGLTIIRNLCYFIYFMFYVRPYFDKKCSWNCFLCIIVAIVATLTSFEVGYLPYSKALFMPNISIKTQAQLGAMHRLSILNLLFINITLITISAVGAVESDLLGNNFLLFVDLGVITLLNSLLTLFFVIKQKPQSFYNGVSNEQTIMNTDAQLNENKEKNGNKVQFTGLKQMKNDDQQFQWMVLSIDY